jgi:hypothetical protein
MMDDKQREAVELIDRVERCALMGDALRRDLVAVLRRVAAEPRATVTVTLMEPAMEPDGSNRQFSVWEIPANSARIIVAPGYRGRQVWAFDADDRQTDGVLVDRRDDYLIG